MLVIGEKNIYLLIKLQQESICITAILSTNLLHEFIVNVKCRMVGLYLLVVEFLETIFGQWNMFNFGEYAEICHLPLTSLKKLNFP